MAASVHSTPKKRQRDLVSLSSTYHDYTHKESSEYTHKEKLSYYLNGAGSMNEMTQKRLKFFQEYEANLLHQP